MFKIYLKIAFRNAFRYKGNSIINIAGLAIGLTCVILIALFINDELSYDRFFNDADQVYRVNLNGKMGDDEFYAGYTPPPAGETLVANFPEIESYTRIYRPGVDVLEYSNGSEKQIFNEENIFAVDANFLEVLSYPMLKGDPIKSLQEGNSVVITNSIIKCHGCGKNSVSWELKQLRSADEGMSAVCKCTNPMCRKSWVM